MLTKELFELALHIEHPWYVKGIQFDSENK